MCDDIKPANKAEFMEENLAKIDPSNIRILVIDDQQTIQDLLNKILSRYGYIVRLAASSDEGLKYLDEGFYDIIYTDLSMPGKSGLEVALEIKKKSPKTVVILITGWALEQEMDSKQLQENGVDLFVTKPFRVNQIYESMKQAMKIKQEKAET